MNKPQVLDHTDDFDQRVSALESDMDTIKSNFEGLTGTLQKSFAKVADDVQGIRDLIAKVITHTNERFKSMDDKIQSTQITLTGQIQSVSDKMDVRMQSLDDKMDDRLQSLDDKMDDRIQSTRNDLQKSFRDDLRDFRRDIKEDVRDSFNGFRWTVGIIVALAVAVMKLLP
ncbi:MAG: hypothetical protein OXH02_07880 [Gemmatimonadetes bacterium]|nr:hypothetical protein [Gemmatimonadota bacterium]